MQADRFIVLPLLVNALPLGADGALKAHKLMKRQNTVTSGIAANLVPIVAEWKGTSRPVLSYVSRHGQPISLDLFESSSNYNAIIAAQSGAGKSVAANDIIASYLSLGARVYVIDIGGSYKALTESLDGEFMVFSQPPTLCLNPFDLVDDFEEEGSMLVDRIKAMAAPSGGLSDWQVSAIQRTLSDLWLTKGKELVVDDVADKLREHEDARARDIGDQLFSFTINGEFGKWFNGKNTVSFTKPLTVLELEQLSGRPQLQAVVLLQLIYRITQDLYLGDRSVPKLIIIDEAWSILAKADVADFISSAYRKARKYRGSIIIITQALSDLQNTVSGRYSELFIAGRTPEGGTLAVIARLILPRFQQLLFTTKAEERTAIEQYMARTGVDRATACKAIEVMETTQ